MSKYHPPVFEGDAFHCVYCDVYAVQSWADVYTILKGSFSQIRNWKRCECARCKGNSLWNSGKLVFPSTSTAPFPHDDLPDECKTDYEEAREIVVLSPKAAAALMRLVLQKLMKVLGEKGANINDDIKSLVAKGLPPLIQKALDFCRVVGNNAVHPGEINLDDTPEVAHHLFAMVNFIVEDRIARPKQVEALYDLLPEGAKEAIDKRDNGKK
jgi:hypothetical protein